MTIDEDRFERDLRSAIRDDAPDVAPSELRRLVSEGLEIASVRPRARSSPWLLGAAASVALVLAVALTWARVAQGPGATSQGSASQLASPAFTGPTSTSMSGGGLTEHPGQVQLGQLITATDGVVINTDGRVLTTANGGVSWRDVTPGVAKPDLTRTFFLDPLHGWVTRFDESAMTGLAIWRTADGGRSWEATSIPALRSVNWELRFLTPTTGFLASDPGGEAPRPQLRWTTDGGATWSDPLEIAAATGLATLQPVEFFSPANGVMAGENVFLHTSDGGVTWSPPTVSNTDFEIVSGTPRYGSPKIIDATTAFVAIDWLDTDGATLGQTIVETFDGGSTWVARYGDARNRTWAFVDATHWIATDGETVWATDDGGTGWGGGTSTGLPVVLDSARLQFVDPMHGWAIATGGPPCNSICFGAARFFELFTTADGGFTWAPVGDCGGGSIFPCSTAKPS